MNLKKYKDRQLLIQYFFRKKYFKIQYKYLLLKYLIKNKFISNQTKVLAIYYIIKLPNTNYKTYHKNICILTGNKRSVFKLFKMNRMSVIDNSSSLFFPGIIKAVW